MKKFISYAQKRGELAENLACRYLESRGFRILERNYMKRCGEIDVIVQKGSMIHFVEVKSVSRENAALKPEDHMDSSKLKRLSKIISTYILEHDVVLWQFDLVCLSVDHRLKRALIWRWNNIVLTES
jgi:putative endonuclease